MDLTTTYMGLKLRSPLVPSASPLSKDLDSVRQLEDAGAGAIVMYSLFEEELKADRLELDDRLTAGTESFGESLSYFPNSDELLLGPEAYLSQLARIKQAVDIPVIASLNGTAGGWTKIAKQMEETGADGIELNLYAVPTDPELTAASIERDYVDVVRAVKTAVGIPVAVKLSPFFTNMAGFAKALDVAGADALVLFNRFYQPDIDIDALEVEPNVLLSTPQALRLPLRWVAILHSRIRADLAATSGIHTAEDVIKVTMAGANVAMMCSALLRYGPGHIREVEETLAAWMEEHEYDSIEGMRGSMSQAKCGNPAAFERAQYMRALAGYSTTTS